jgi:dTDP-glucose pyrophosphorylase
MIDCTNITLPSSAVLFQALELIDKGSRQVALVVDEVHRLVGTLTDGDIRRAILRGADLQTPVRDVMHADCLSVRPGLSRDLLLALMHAKAIRHLPVIDEEGRLLGLEVLDELLLDGARDNWVVIMAGGLGIRMRPLTENCPKPMLKVGGQPLLSITIDMFRKQGFRNFLLAVNYLATTIQEFFEDGSRLGVRIEYLFEKERMGTAGAISLLPEHVDGPVLMINGDILTTLDFTALLDFHAQQGAPLTAAVREFSYQIPYGVARVDGETLTGLTEKPTQSFQVLAGIYVVDAPFARALPKACLDMPDLLSSMLRQGKRVPVYDIREYWLDIGKIEDYERANNDFPSLIQP